MTTAARYRLLAKWASGGMADIYVARQQGMAGFDKIVALKFLRDIGDSHGVREMFLDEVRTAALLNHPNIVQTFDADQLGERLFLAMEFVNGETLGKFARQVISASGSFPVELAVAICRDLANALDYAHSLKNLDGEPLDLVHRDVSPSNILLSFDGMTKLLDFGIAKVSTKLTATGVGVIKGKFSYMAPEQARGMAVDARADIYSLGIVLWQLLTGKSAFEAASDAELLRMVANPLLAAPSVAGAKTTEILDEIVMQALAPQVEARYETAGEFATALSRYLTRHAAGFDATKLTRGLMNVHFSERRDRLAALIKRNQPDFALDEVEALYQQPSLRTPTPKVTQAPTQTANTISELEPSGPVSAISKLPPRRAKRWPWVMALIFLVATGGVLAMRTFEDDTATKPVAIAKPRIVEQRSQMEATAPPAVVPQDAASEPVEPPDAAPIEPSINRAAVAMPARPVVRPAPARVAVSRPSTRPITAKPAPATGSGSAKPSTGSGSGSATKLAQGSGSSVEEPIAPKPEPAPRVAPIAPAPSAPVRDVGTLDATAAVVRVAVNGSLTTSEVQSALERTTGQLRDCYRAAAGKAQSTPAVALKVSFVIDEARAPRGVVVTGDPIGLGACAREAIANIRTRSAPDVGTVSVVAQISFKPTRKATP